jgi:hypothetical protein
MIVSNWKRFVNLVEEAMQRTARMGETYEVALVPVFNDALNVINASTANSRNQLLILSAARRHITIAEKHAVAWMIGDDRINSQSMSDLVRVRLICSELLGMLNNAIDEIKGLPSRW